MCKGHLQSGYSPLFSSQNVHTSWDLGQETFVAFSVCIPTVTIKGKHAQLNVEKTKMILSILFQFQRDTTGFSPDQMVLI